MGSASGRSVFTGSLHNEREAQLGKWFIHSDIIDYQEKRKALSSLLIQPFVIIKSNKLYDVKKTKSQKKLSNKKMCATYVMAWHLSIK